MTISRCVQQDRHGIAAAAGRHKIRIAVIVHVRRAQRRGIGSNIDAESNVSKAVEMIRAEYELLARSTWRWTAPVGYKNQPDFLNGAVLIRTALDREQLVDSLKTIELYLHREHRSDKYGPRTIDLDIVVWNGRIIDEDVYQRDFLKAAVLECMPDLKI